MIGNPFRAAAGAEDGEDRKQPSIPTDTFLSMTSQFLSETISNE